MTPTRVALVTRCLIEFTSRVYIVLARSAENARVLPNDLVAFHRTFNAKLAEAGQTNNLWSRWGNARNSRLSGQPLCSPELPKDFVVVVAEILLKTYKTKMIALSHTVLYLIWLISTKLSMPAWQKEVRQITNETVQAMNEAKMSNERASGFM